MKIRHIKILDLRAIKVLNLDLAPGERAPLDLAVLAGPNGCGKTSVLEACLWGLKQDALMLMPRPLPRQPYSITLTVEHDCKTYHVTRTPDRHTIEGDGLPLMSLPKKGLPDWLRVRALYFSSWRAPRLIGSVGLSTDQAKRTARTQNNALARLKQFLVDLQGASAFPGSSRSDTPSAAELFDRIADLWGEFYPGRDGRFQGAVVNGLGHLTTANGQAEDPGNGLRFDLLLKDRDRPGGIAVDDLSSGEIEALSMIGTFVMERPGPDLVLVDEPELHLHPAWHRAVMRVLRRAVPGAQLICATHSEHILDAVYSHQRFTLLPENDPRLRLAAGV